MAENIDISTHQLGELAYNALNGKVSLETILTIWHNIGNSTIGLQTVILTLLMNRRSCKTVSRPKEGSKTKFLWNFFIEY